MKEVLQAAESERTVEYLEDLSNWISYDEAVALWRAGAQITHHPQFARLVGETAARHLNASPVAALLRSLGSPEHVYGQVARTASKFSSVVEMEAVEVGPGFVEIVAVPAEGFSRSDDHCAWTCGLLTQPTVLFGLPPATVEHDECAAFGAPCCRYRVTWDVDETAVGAESSAQIGALQGQLEAMKERLHSMFATASDLIDAGEIGDVLARITDRAGVEVRAPRYLLAVRTSPGGAVHYHHKGFDEREAIAVAERILKEHPASLPEGWLVVPVQSKRQDYGRLLAMNERGLPFFRQEHELLEVYARYAASAMDGATALQEAKQRYNQSSALLKLARALAEAGTSGEVARRLADAVPVVVDCDRVGVYLWDTVSGELVESSTSGGDEADLAPEPEAASWIPPSSGPLARLLRDPRSGPVFVDCEHEDPVLCKLLDAISSAAMIVVPLAAADSLLGLLVVSVTDAGERLQPSDDLLDRLSGVAAQATIALQNGRLVDQITHQALHDGLTGLANRMRFADKLGRAIHRAREGAETVTVFYIDLDRFKPVNDQFGHDVGDALLSLVADRLMDRTRGTDVVARLGGDEFGVLIDGPTSPQDSEMLTARLNQAFATPFLVGTQRLTVGASIGRAVFPDDAQDAEGLLRMADEAMFSAKRANLELAPARV